MGRSRRRRLSELEKLKEFCTGIDTVVHIAANPVSQRGPGTASPGQHVGTYYIFVAAKVRGVVA